MSAHVLPLHRRGKEGRAEGAHGTFRLALRELKRNPPLTLALSPSEWEREASDARSAAGILRSTTESGTRSGLDVIVGVSDGGRPFSLQIRAGCPARSPAEFGFAARANRALGNGSRAASRARTHLGLGGRRREEAGIDRIHKGPPAYVGRSPARMGQGRKSFALMERFSPAQAMAASPPRTNR